MSPSRLRAQGTIVAFALLFGCAHQSQLAALGSQRTTDEAAILVGSSPAAGSSVSAPVDELVLRFRPAAALDEVTVTGPQGTMPMMITPVGEVPAYTIPLPGLGTGSYVVNWRATSGRRPYRGSFAFSVR